MRILLWILIWFGFFSISNVLLSTKKFTYVERPFVNRILFILASCVVFLAFKKEFLFYLHLQSLEYLVLITFVGLMFLTYFILRHFTEEYPALEKGQYSNIEYSYLFSKGLEILFQDLMILVILSIFNSLFFNKLQFILLFSLFFGLVHSPILFFVRSKNYQFLVFCSFVFGLLLPVIYLLPAFNFVYLYIAHWLFYLIAGVLYRISFTFRSFLQGGI